MAEDGLLIAIAIALDVAFTRGTKRHMWVRVIGVLSTLIFVGAVGLAIYVTFKYS